MILYCRLEAKEHMLDILRPAEIHWYARPNLQLLAPHEHAADLRRLGGEDIEDHALGG